MVCAPFFHPTSASIKMPLVQHPTHPHETPPRPSIGNPLSDEVSRRHFLTQQIRDCEDNLEVLKNELEQTDLVIKTLQTTDTAMQRYWETISRLPPMSLEDPNVTALLPESDDDVDSVNANPSA